jgi:hypothetical protein
MHKISVVILAVFLAGTSLADDSALDLSQDCWKTDEPDDGVSLAIIFCVDGEVVKVSVFYPNRDYDSTTCRSSGQVESIDSTTLVIRIGQGHCENGRPLAPSDWTCTLLNEFELNCLDRVFNQIHLNREATETVER